MLTLRSAFRHRTAIVGTGLRFVLFNECRYSRSRQVLQFAFQYHCFAATAFLDFQQHLPGRIGRGGRNFLRVVPPQAVFRIAGLADIITIRFQAMQNVNVKRHDV